MWIGPVHARVCDAGIAVPLVGLAVSRTVVLSDAHLDGCDDPAQLAFVDLVDGLGGAHLVLAGDLFDVWWGPWGEIPAAVAPACSALERFVGRGGRVSFVPGNRDFAVGSFFEDVLGAEVAAEVKIEGAGRRWAVVHGDEADDSLGYRTATWVLRGRAFGALVQALGPRSGDRFLRWLGGTSRAHMAPAPPLVTAQQRWGVDRIARGDVDAVAMGHSHALGVHESAGGLVVHLGDWAEQRSFLELTVEQAVLCAGRSRRRLAAATAPASRS